MKALLDSFVMYLSTELAGVLPVAYLQALPGTPDAERFVLNALNVRVLAPSATIGHLEEALLSLDVVGQDERQVLGWVTTVQDLLRSCLYTPEYQYEPDPSTPVATGVNVFWDMGDVDFEVAGSSPSLVQMTCTLPIRHVRTTYS
jgi:hypothetical protein